MLASFILTVIFFIIMTNIFRMSKNLISVDGIRCKKNSYDGRYYPVREDLTNVNLFADVIDSFLLQEEDINQERFESKLIDMVEDSGLFFPYRPEDNNNDIDKFHLN